MPMPPVARAKATTTDSRMMPITSSMTAAPRMVEPSRERSAFSSISVCAEMLTLVAVRIVPMKRPVQKNGRPNAIAVSAPPPSGRITPPNAAQNATLPTRRISTRSVSSPAMNISRITPISARSRSDPMSGPGAGPCAGSIALANTGQPSTSSIVGPSTRPARISPKTAGCPTRLAAAPESLAAATISASTRRSCRRCVIGIGPCGNGRDAVF